MAELVDQLSKFVSPESLVDGNGMVTDAARRGPRIGEIKPGDEGVAIGRPALLPMGVLYQADWKKLDDGMARHARRQVKALAMAGVPVSLRSISDERMHLDEEADPRVWHEVGHISRTSIGSASIAIRHLVLHNTDVLRSIIAPPGARLAGFEAERRVWASTIVYTSWERSTVSRGIVDILNRCGQVWLPCSTSRAVFRAAGVNEERLRVVPYPYDPDSAVCQLAQPRGNGLVPPGLRFYNIGKWEPRKNQHGLIGAFLREFKPTERASLYIKTHGWGEWKDYPSPEGSIAHWLADDAVKANGWTAELLKKRVWIVDRKLSDEGIVRLHERNNIYVSASHGEGWDIPAFDARCAGNRLVHVGYGASAEFVGAGDVAVGWRLAPVHPDYGWESNAQWAEYDLASLGASMRHATPPEERVHPTRFVEQYGQVAVGARMRHNVLELVDKLDPTNDFRGAPGGFG